MNAMTSSLAAGVTIAELPPTTRIALRAATGAAIGAAIGLALPTTIGARERQGGRTALCLGPDEWLIEAPEADRDALLASLAGAPGPMSVVEVSDREITLALEGPAVRDLLATGCPRDLGRLPVGAGARTVFDTAQVVVTRETQDRYHLTVWRSFLPHVRALLDLAERELAAGL